MNTTGVLAASRSRTPSSSSNSRPWAEPMLRPDAESSATGPRSGHEPRQLGATLAEEGLQLGLAGAPDQPAERLHDGRVGQGALAEHDAAALEHIHALAACHLGELDHQPRLADAGLATDDGRTGSPLQGEIEAARSRSSSLERPMSTGLERGPHAADYRAKHQRAPVTVARSARAVARSARAALQLPRSGR